jgi:chemotaxis family two-component system sensor kinase Cph1
MSETIIAPLDKTDCAYEPIHIPGSIQPHGYLVIIDGSDHAVVAVSQNLADALELSPSDMVGRPVSDFLVSTTAEALDSAIDTRNRGRPIRVAMRSPHRLDELDGLARFDDGLILLELEASLSAERTSDLFGEVRVAIERIRDSASAEVACQALAEEVRRLSGFERVMVYRFDEDWNGQVVAEDRLAGVQSYLGHAFPASDIPAQARALYRRTMFRVIPDARYQPSPIEPSVQPENGRPFDLTNVTLRSVSPVHLKYLANMGVGASMSVSIIRDDQLWGLVACHHSSPRILPQSVLQSCNLLAQAASWCLDANDRAVAVLSLAAARRLEADLERSKHPDFTDRLASVEAPLLAMIRSDGLAIWEPQRVWAIGQCPSPPQLKALAAWLTASGKDRIATDKLPLLYPPAADFVSLASGIIAVRLDGGWLISCRAEWRHSLTWAGRPGQAHHRDGETGRINPRRSFAAWREKVRGRSAPWTPTDVSAVDELRAIVLKAMMADQLRQLRDDERALMEAKLDAEAATQAKSVFLAQMSHEIRTPLNGLLGMAQVMAANALTDDQRGRLTVMQKSGASLLAILNDILDLSKIEAGLVDLEDLPFDIAEVVDDVSAVFGAIASEKGVGLVVDIRDDARGMWRGDPVRVRQLISNLVSNGLKFTGQGEVRVTVDGPLIDGLKVLSISVADSGIGILPDALPKLFEPFVQADNSTTRRFGGSGLGLTICRDIAELMGGEINVRSTVGKGTVFDVRLPLTWEGGSLAASEVSLEVEDEGDISSLRVLAAEDNETNRVVLKAILGTWDIVAEVVENGRLAVDAWSSGQFDLVLMDIQMPVLDGLLATSEIRRIETVRGLQKTPIFALSANGMKHQVAEYLAGGFDGYIAKPIVMSDLYAALCSVAVKKLTDEAA